MKRLAERQHVGLTVGEHTVDCQVLVVNGNEAVLHALEERALKMLPAAGAASLVFEHPGGLVMLRGAIYRGSSPQDLRFAVTNRPRATEQRRKAARLPIALPVTLVPVDAGGAPTDEPRRTLTRDISIAGIGVLTNDDSYSTGGLLRFELTPANGTSVAGTAQIVRMTTEVVGMKIVTLPPAERVRQRRHV
jgi:hypothetical protein